MSFEPTGVYSRIPYRTAQDGSVEAMFPGGIVKFRDVNEFYETFPATRHKRVAKIVAMAVGGFVLLFIGLAAFLELTETISYDETYARANGLSISECIQVARNFGSTVPAADEMCRKRQPKKR